MAKIVTGLDIGSESIKLVQVKRTRGDAYSVVASASMEISSDTGATGNAAVAETLKKLIAQSKIHPVNLVVAVPKQAVVVRYIKLPTNSVVEVQQMVRFEAPKYVPFFSEEDIVDFEMIASSPLGGSEILLVVARRSLIEEQLTMLRSLHLEPYSFDVSSLALVRGLRQAYPSLAKESDKAHLVVDLGANSMELSLVQNKTLRYTRSATISGAQLVKALQDNLNISSQEAQALIRKLDFTKLNLGIDKHPGETLEETVMGWFDRVSNEIKRSMDYFVTEFGISHLQSMILSGGLVQIPSLKEQFEKDLGIPVNIVNLMES